MTGKSQHRNVLIRFRHGLGDAVQLTVVLKHLQRDHPGWNVDVAALVGKHSAFRGLCRNVFVLDRDRYSIGDYAEVLDLDWPECATCYRDCPSTKAECCLRDVFRLTPRPELCRYLIARGEEATEEARRYLGQICKTNPDDRGRFPAVPIHYEGNTSADAKDLPVELIRAVCEEIIGLGLVPVILDWDQRSPLPDDVRIFNPHADLDLWGRTGTGDAEVLAALIEQSTLMIGIDSGPLHVAGAASTPTIAVWTGHHPLHYFSLAENVLHLVPERHADLLRRGRDAGLAYFKKNYRHAVYEDLASSLPSVVRRELIGANGGLIRRCGFWVRSDNVEQDLVVVRDIVEEDSYRVDELPMTRPVVVDVGAHIGCFTRRFHAHNPTAHIIAVECCPENIPALRKNAGSIATVVEGALTYEPDVAILNAVYPGCVSTGGSTVLPRAELERRVESQQLGERPEDGESRRYWADFRDVRTLSVEELLEDHRIDRIDVLKLDCEGSEFSILENTTSRDHIGVIVGEYHGKRRFEELVRNRFAGWEFTVFRDEDPGTFRLVNPDYERGSRNGNGAVVDAPKRGHETNGIAQPMPESQNGLPPLLVAALRDGEPPTYHLLRMEAGAVVDTYDHPVGWLRGFARHDGRLWTIDSMGRIFRVSVNETGITLEVVAESRLASKAHDLLFHDGRFLTAGPDQNAVVSYDPRTGTWEARHPWMPPPVPRADVEIRYSADEHHLNSVLPDEDGFLLSYFSESPRPKGKRWRETNLDEGKIVRWGPRGFDPAPVATGVYAPHSLRRHAGRIWWCDSFRRRVCRDDGWRSPDLGGFTRGMAFHRERCIVGLSRSRVDPYPEAKTCGVCAFDPANPEDRAVVELDGAFIEVYDVVPLDSPA
ncbi:MAG: FkbM family methyltransferase [Planctomycetaceae bacterium]